MSKSKSSLLWYLLGLTLHCHKSRIDYHIPGGNDPWRKVCDCLFQDLNTINPEDRSPTWVRGKWKIRMRSDK